MVEYAIKESKKQPDFSGSDEQAVVLALPGEVHDPQFLQFLERVGVDKVAGFVTAHLLILDLINQDRPIPPELSERLPYLLEHGIVENAGRQKYILSRGLYGFLGKKGVYTRKMGLDRETNKLLILKHIQDNAEEGSRFADLAQVLPSFSGNQLRVLLREMQAEGSIRVIGTTKAARWYPEPEATR